jgi:pimeloyl-ACP methyl ester carboxylesterase
VTPAQAPPTGGRFEPWADFAALLLALVAIAAIGTGLWRLGTASAGLTITTQRVGEVPVTLYRPADEAPAPVVVIGHGFAGSQQLMQPFAVTLARNGFLAVTFDFPGHGRNPIPFVARIDDEERRVGILLGALEQVASFAAGLPGADAQLALLGHSMAGDVLVRYAAAHRDQVAASVLVSPYLGPDAPRTEPRNLLFLVGALEPEMLRQASREAIAQASGGELPNADAVAIGVDYGELTAGSARRLVLVPGVEHIGVLYGQGGLSAALDWLNQAFGRTGEGFIDARGRSLALLFLGLVALAWPLSRLLPRAATRPLGAGLPWRRLLPVALVPAVLTPVILRLVPSDYLPILLGDYLALHFGLYGLLTAAGLWWTLARQRGDPAVTVAPAGPGRTLWSGLLIGTLAAAAYLTLVMAVPIDRYVTAFLPAAGRGWLILAIVPGTWAYFAADGWLTRGPGAPRGAGVFTKALFLISLLVAVALNLNALFFLIIIVPAILVFFLLYGLIGSWLYRRTWHPLVGGLAIGLAFAWAIAVTFPLVA